MATDKTVADVVQSLKSPSIFRDHIVKDLVSHMPNVLATLTFSYLEGTPPRTEGDCGKATHNFARLREMVGRVGACVNGAGRYRLEGAYTSA